MALLNHSETDETSLLAPVKTPFEPFKKPPLIPCKDHFLPPETDVINLHFLPLQAYTTSPPALHLIKISESKEGKPETSAQIQR